MDEMGSCEVFAALFFAWENQQSSNRPPIASSCFFLLLFLLLLPSKDNRHARGDGGGCDVGSSKRNALQQNEMIQNAWGIPSHNTEYNDAESQKNQRAKDRKSVV